MDHVRMKMERMVGKIQTSIDRLGSYIVVLSTSLINGVGKELFHALLYTLCSINMECEESDCVSGMTYYCKIIKFH